MSQSKTVMQQTTGCNGNICQMESCAIGRGCVCEHVWGHHSEVAQLEGLWKASIDFDASVEYLSTRERTGESTGDRQRAMKRCRDRCTIVNKWKKDNFCSIEKSIKESLAAEHMAESSDTDALIDFQSSEYKRNISQRSQSFHKDDLGDSPNNGAEMTEVGGRSENGEKKSQHQAPLAQIQNASPTFASVHQERGSRADIGIMAPKSWLQGHAAPTASQIGVLAEDLKTRIDRFLKIFSIRRVSDEEPDCDWIEVEYENGWLTQHAVGNSDTESVSDREEGSDG